MDCGNIVCVIGMAVVVAATTVSGDLIRGIDIDFVTIGHAGNVPDVGGGGAVDHDYSIGKYEITNAQWAAFTAAAGAPVGTNGGYGYSTFFMGSQQPVTGVSWYEAAQFCNYLTSGDKSKGAYQFSGDNANPGAFVGIDRDLAFSDYGTIYCLPTENEWYKAAYFTPDGDGYSLYANGLSYVPLPDDGWNWQGGAYDTPWDVGTGNEEQNGTYDMMGNVNEWNETIVDSHRSVRGGYYMKPSDRSESSHWSYSAVPEYELQSLGFRVVAIPVPEPSAIIVGSIGLACARTMLPRFAERKGTRNKRTYGKTGDSHLFWV